MCHKEVIVMPKTIKGEITVRDIQYEYSEVKRGGGGAGSRGISIWKKGTADDKRDYKFKPNPHSNKWYSKNQPMFYKEAAEAIVAERNANGVWPTTNDLNNLTTITINKEDYTLEAF
jgi:hypothetical protein